MPADLIAKQEPKMIAYFTAMVDPSGMTEPFRPVIEGEEFTDQPLELFRNGKWQTDKEILIGTNIQELETVQYETPDQGLYDEEYYRVTTCMCRLLYRFII